MCEEWDEVTPSNQTIAMREWRREMAQLQRRREEAAAKAAVGAVVIVTIVLLALVGAAQALLDARNVRRLPRVVGGAPVIMSIEPQYVETRLWHHVEPGMEPHFDSDVIEFVDGNDNVVLGVLP